MPASGDFEAFVPAELASVGIAADEVELAVMRVLHETYWPALTALLEVDLHGVEPETVLDLSQAPR